jgi:hypothetical protein
MGSEFTHYDLGETVVLSVTFEAAPTSVVATVLAPDGTTSTPTVEVSGAPTYTAEVTADAVGTWAYQFVGTGAFEGIEEGYFVIAPSVMSGAAYTYDPATTIGKVRLYTDDRDISYVNPNVPLDQRSAVWTDGELQVFLDNNDNDAYLASAEALTVLAANRQLLVQSRRIGQTTVDFGSVRSDLLRQAEQYRTQAYAQDPASAFAEHSWTDFNARRIITNDLLRNG